jgi:D-tyrosyl-tRNA(Tyr) deacylase
MTNLCPEFGCNYPEGECAGVCRRNQAIGINGNTGEHYAEMSQSYVRVVAVYKGQIIVDYHANWLGDVDVLRRARVMLDLLIEESEA